MPNVTSLFHRAGQTLGRHLDRLRSTFDELRDRVRDAAVQAIGQSVAGAIRDSLGAFLEGVASRSPEVPSLAWSRSPPSWQQDDGLFNEPLDRDRHRYEPELRGPYDHDDLDDEPLPRPTQEVPAEEPRPSRWRQAFAVGFSAAAWHLRWEVRERQENDLPFPLLIRFNGVSQGGDVHDSTHGRRHSDDPVSGKIAYPCSLPHSDRIIAKLAVASVAVGIWQALGGALPRFSLSFSIVPR